MRRFLIPVLLLGLLAGCSGARIGPHRIDVQQGNALDQENVSRLKPDLSRSQVRFLLGTPLVVDPFRTDRWDYVYVFYKAGKLAEQRRITLFFEGDTLARIEGDLPEPAAPPTAEPQPAPPQTDPATPAAAPLAAEPAAQVEPPAAEPVAQPPSGASEPAASQPAPTPAAPTAAPAAQPAATPPAETSVVPPLPSPDNAPPYVDPRPSAELSLRPETDVARIQPDVMPPFPDPHPAAPGGDDPVLKAVNEWAAAWARHDGEAYLAAYDATYVPQGGDSRAEWEKRRRLLLGMAGDIDLRIDSPAVERTADNAATVTFNQFYRSANYRDAVVKQLRMIERDGRWLIIEEKVLSILPGARP